MLTVKYNHSVMLEDIKLLIDGGVIHFPLSVENGYIEEDGFSLGYPVDSGEYAIVTFERAVGALAEDTVALHEEYQARKNSKECSFDLSDFVKFRSIDNWWGDLPPLSAAEQEQGYWGWSPEHQAAWDKAHLFDDLDQNPLFTLDGQSFWDTEYGMFMQRPAMFDDLSSGKIMPAKLIDGVEIDDLLAVVQAKLDLIDTQKQLAKQIKENLDMLSTVFGYKAQAQA